MPVKLKGALLQSPFMKEEKIRVIYNDLYTENIDHMAIPTPKSNNSFIVTALGTPAYRKVFDFLIRGFTRFFVHPISTRAGESEEVISDGENGFLVD